MTSYHGIFQHDPIWNDGALDFFEEVPQQIEWQQKQHQLDEYWYEISFWSKNGPSNFPI